MPVYRAIPRVRDLRSDEPAQNTAKVTVEPASETTNDEPLTDARVAPEASPAKTKKRRSKKAAK